MPGTAVRTIFAMILMIASISMPVWSMQQSDQDTPIDQPKAEPAPPPLPPAAPVPSPILNGRKVFISNGGADVDISPDHYSGGPDRAYNEFYAAMKSWNHYVLASDPGDADLIFEFAFIAPPGQVDVTKGGGGSFPNPQFTLVIRDRKTNAILWAFTEHIVQRNHATHDQSFDQTINRLVDDMKKLVGEKPAEKTNRQ